MPPPVAGTPIKSAAADPRAQGADNPRSPLNMDFLSRRTEARRALNDSDDYATGLIEADAVADGAGMAERASLGLQPLPPGEAIWAAPSGFWEPCTALLQVTSGPTMHLVRQSPGGARGAVHLLLPEWAVRPFVAQELNTKHPFAERPLHVPRAPSHIHKCEAHSEGVARWLPVWVPPPSHPMYRALWGGAGLDATGSSTVHMGMVSSDLRCSVVSASHMMTVDEARAQGSTLEEVESTAGRRVMERSMSVQLEVHGEPWGHAAESEQHNPTASDASSDVGSTAAAVRGTGLCSNLMKLRSWVLEGKLTSGQLRAGVMQFSGRTRIAMEAVPELARVLAEDAVPTTPVHAGEFELLLGCLRSHFDTYRGPPATSPPVRGAAAAPAPSLTPGARGLRVVIVPDTEESASGAPSSDVSDITAPSTSWVAVSPSHLDLDTP